MILDHITALADELGVPTNVECRPRISPAGQIIERLEALFLIDHDSRFDPPYLGERFRKVIDR